VTPITCRNRHCPKCQGAAARQWLAEREAELLPVPYYHVVFTLPAAIGAVAFQNKAVVYDLLFRTAAETLTTIAADPKHLGARIGLTAVLHTWGSALTHHPHVHCIVPGGGLSADGQRWVAYRPGFFLPVRVLSRLFRRLFLDKLEAAHIAGRLVVFGDLAPLANTEAFKAHLRPLRRAEWVVYAKRPFGGPAAVLAYLARYTHRVAISNSRLVAMDQRSVSFRWKDYRTENPDTGAVKIKCMTLSPDEFLRRFTEAMDALVVGDPFDPATQVGPIVTEAQRAELMGQIEEARSQGAVVHGGTAVDGPGWYFKPAVLSGVTADMPVAQEEIFGPVAIVERVPDLTAAIEVANSTTFGLGSSVWTNDEEEQRRCIEEIEAGAVFVNAMVVSTPELPFGGIKRSGFGRELSELGLKEFTNAKTVWIT